MLRKHTPSDTDALVSIWENANALAHPFLDPDFVASVKDAMRNIYLPKAETWVFEAENTPIGFIAMIDDEIGGLFLDPAHHGRGYGRAMVDHVVQSRGPLRVDVFKENSIGRAFYDRYGFVYQREYRHAPSGAITVHMAMPGARVD